MMLFSPSVYHGSAESDRERIVIVTKFLPEATVYDHSIIRSFCNGSGETDPEFFQGQKRYKLLR